jgi:hypothetical protein
MRQFLLIYWNRNNKLSLKWFDYEKQAMDYIKENDKKIEIKCCLEVKRFL